GGSKPKARATLLKRIKRLEQECDVAWANLNEAKKRLHEAELQAMSPSERRFAKSMEAHGAEVRACADAKMGPETVRFWNEYAARH
ncbi:MAG: hypothetical protein RLZZ324_403, partial [Candidatus Parcubacteria bacterium]